MKIFLKCQKNTKFEDFFRYKIRYEDKNHKRFISRSPIGFV